MYTALQFCRFGGKEFRIGEEIPEKLLDPKAIPRLKSSGMIAEHSVSSLLSDAGSIEDEVMFEIPLIKDGETIIAKLTEEKVKIWATVLQNAATEAGAIIETIDDNDLLMVIHATDGRKGVKTAAEARAAVINAMPEEEPEEVAEEVTEEPAEASPTE